MEIHLWVLQYPCLYLLNNCASMIWTPRHLYIIPIWIDLAEYDEDEVYQNQGTSLDVADKKPTRKIWTSAPIDCLLYIPCNQLGNIYVKPIGSCNLIHLDYIRRGREPSICSLQAIISTLVNLSIQDKISTSNLTYKVPCTQASINPCVIVCYTSDFLCAYCRS